MKALLAALMLLAGSVAAAAAPPSEAMAAAAKTFYGIYERAGRSGGIPDDALRARYAPLLSPGLGTLLAEAAAAEAKFAAQNKDSPPLFEGDLFTSLFEGATGFEVGACAGDAARGHCAVALRYAMAGQKPQNWTDTVMLVNTPSGWRVDDIVYGGKWDFANEGSLRETLKMVIAEIP